MTWLPGIFVRTTHGTSLVVQWLRLHTSNTGGPSSSADQGTRAQVPQLKILHAETKAENPTCHNQDPAQPTKCINTYINVFLKKDH